VSLLYARVALATPSHPHHSSRFTQVLLRMSSAKPSNWIKQGGDDLRLSGVLKMKNVKFS
jgi:hypothetical protein